MVTDNDTKQKDRAQTKQALKEQKK